MLGRRPGESKTGLGTVKEVEEFRIHPNTIKELPTGRAILITKNPTAQARIVQVTQPQQRMASRSLPIAYAEPDQQARLDSPLRKL
jgi:hypothetical protein